MDTATAVARLNALLPLKQRQDALSPPLKALHQEILRCLIDHGRPLTAAEIVAQLGSNTAAHAINTLAANDLVVLDAETKNLRGAYPVTVEQTPHAILVKGNHIHAMCALDAVAVAPMFNTHVRIDSTCHVSQVALRIEMDGPTLLNTSPSAEVIVGIRWQQPASVAAHSLCMEMVFLKDRQVANTWKANDDNHISLFTLPQAVEFGCAFFQPLMA